MNVSSLQAIRWSVKIVLVSLILGFLAFGVFIAFPHSTLTKGIGWSAVVFLIGATYALFVLVLEYGYAHLPLRWHGGNGWGFVKAAAILVIIGPGLFLVKMLVEQLMR